MSDKHYVTVQLEMTTYIYFHSVSMQCGDSVEAIIARALDAGVQHHLFQYVPKLSPNDLTRG